MKKAGLLLALLSCVTCALPAAAAETPAPASSAAAWKFDNPFCEVLAGLVPSEGAPGSHYGLELFASHGTRVAAHVTLIGADAAYDANVAAVNLEGAAQDRRTDAIVVAFAKPAVIHYFFVDSYSIDGGAPVECPSYVFLSGSGPSEDAMGGLGLTTVTAAFLQTLPNLPCGNAYREPSIAKGFDPPVGFYGNKRLTTKLHVYVDSNGKAIRASLEASSGVEGLDDAALAGVQYTKYHPAQFLCTPVVGEVDMTMEYSP